MPGNSEWLSQDRSPSMAFVCICDINPKLHDMVPEGSESKHDDDDDNYNINHNQLRSQ